MNLAAVALLLWLSPSPAPLSSRSSSPPAPLSSRSSSPPAPLGRLEAVHHGRASAPFDPNLYRSAVDTEVTYDDRIAEIYDDGYGPQAYAQFEAALAPFGAWIDDAALGRVWAPSAAVVGPGFSPYATNGSWVLTEYGWTWDTAWTWGWAPFHYGRWTVLDKRGWVWVPGTLWGPAWVAWRAGRHYVGWAPLPPRGMHLGRPIGPRSPWRFVPADALGRASLPFVPLPMVPPIFVRTIALSNVRSIKVGSLGVRVTAGPIRKKGCCGGPQPTPAPLASAAPSALPRLDDPAAPGRPPRVASVDRGGRPRADPHPSLADARLLTTISERMQSSAADQGIDPRGGERGRVLALVRRFGWNATSFQVLEPGYCYFFLDAEACVAYVDTGRAWVAAGAPLAEETRMIEVAAAFVAAARAAGRRACFFATEARFAALVTLRSFLVGEQAIWDPAGWAAALRGSRSLREQLRRARAKGVRVRAMDTDQATAPGHPTRGAMVALVERWQRTRELAPLGFLARVEPLALLPDQRLFLAERDGALVALLSVAPICGREGWLLQNLLRAPDAPNGTAETLIDRAMRDALCEERTVVTLGLAPLAGGVGAPLRLARTAGAALYNFEGLRAFKAKLMPARWDPIYVSFPPETGPGRALVDVLGAFARGGLLRFGLRTLLRGPAVIVTLLATLLVPWTVLLATVESGRWFPHPAVKWAWVGFDALLAAGLFALRARWRDRLARLLTAAIGADAVLTAIEGAWWNVPRASGILAKIALAAAVAAPALAFLVLARTSIRRSASRSAAPIA